MANRKVVNVLVSRNKNGETSVDAANDFAVVKPEELKATSSSLESLTMNLMAGKVGAPIRKAKDNGKLSEVMPGNQLKNQRSALDFLMDIPPETIREKWDEYCENRKRVTPPTLQRLHGLCKPEPEDKPKPVNWKAYGQAIIAAREAGDSAKVDQLIYDLGVEAGIPVEPKH